MRPIIIGNWKMNTILSDAVILTTQIKNVASEIEAEIVICPPFTWLYPLSELLENAPENLYLGAQNMWFAEKGAMTGEISPMMLKDLARYVILGHSERRSHFMESNALINDKVHSALSHGITPILCLSEFKKMQDVRRGRGRPTGAELRSDIFQQLTSCLRGVPEKEIGKIIIAFEPVWAMSTTAETEGAASGVYVANVLSQIRNYLEEKYDSDAVKTTRLIYGGSVDAKNISEFLYQPEIDGALVGAASLKASEFIKICQIAGTEG